MSTFTARLFLGFNAAFSLITGVALVTYPELLFNWIWSTDYGWGPPMFRLLGVGLMLFALALVWLASNRFVKRKEVLWIVCADAGWVVGSALLILSVGDALTERGVMVVVVVALAVAVFAVGQLFGVCRIKPVQSKVGYKTTDGLLKATVKRDVSASEYVVWQVMTDHPGYANVASNITKVEVLSGDGLGMQRRCYGPKGENWIETCDWFEAGKSFGFTVHTDVVDYPYPFSSVQGRWSVLPQPTGSVFSVDIAVEPRGGWLMKKLFPLLAPRQFTPILVDLADAWAARMETREEAGKNEDVGN